MDNPEMDAEDFVWLVAGVMYATGHGPIVLTEQGMRRAVAASSELLAAIGLTPTHWRVHVEETIDWPGARNER